MRRYVAALALSVLSALACAKKEQPAADSAAMAPAPAAMTDADFSGTWTGMAKLAGTDSVIAHWTQVCGGGTCLGTSVEAPDTVKSTYAIEADSSHGVTSPYVDKAMGGARVVDHWIARVSGGTVQGHGWFVLADKPDSVVARYTFEGTRK